MGNLFLNIETSPVEHVLHRDILRHDQEWNLTVSHRICNDNKSDKILGEHYIEKLFLEMRILLGAIILRKK